ncbi:MAG TPA: amidohydrolase, partial [Pirellula sp.]|nr:amidohydrolase [Pirellula sp.]
MNYRREFLNVVAASAVVAPLASKLSLSLLAADPPPMMIDTHQHLWDLERQKLPWLSGAPDILKRTYHLMEYREATQGLSIKAIYMEVAVDGSQLNQEAEHVISLSRNPSTPTIAAVIGCRPESSLFADYITKFKSVSEVKGARRVLHEAETPAGFCLQPEFVKSVQKLGELGRSFDLC